MYYVYFPEAIIQLSIEIQHHPLLLQRLEKHPQDADNMELRFAEIAAYCDVLLDDWYNESDFARIADICLTRLKAMRPREGIYIPPENWEQYLEGVNKEKHDKMTPEQREWFARNKLLH